MLNLTRQITQQGV